MATNHPNWISKSRVLLMLSPSRAPHSMKKPSRLPWIRNVLQIPWLFFITLNISATLPCSPHWPSKGFLLANGLLLSIWLKLYLCLWSQKVFLVSLIFAPSPNWTMQTVPIRHFGGNFLVWLCIFYVEDTRTHIKYVCGWKYHTVEKGWDAIMADTTIDRMWRQGEFWTNLQWIHVKTGRYIGNIFKSFLYLPGGFVCRWVDKSCCNVHSSWRSYFLQLGFKRLLIQEENCCCQNSKGEGKEIPLRHCFRNLKILYDKEPSLCSSLFLSHNSAWTA